MGDSVFRLGLGFLVSVWLARDLGPDGFGIYNDSFALFAVATAFAAVGMNGIVVKEILADSRSLDVINGAVLQLITPDKQDEFIKQLNWVLNQDRAALQEPSLIMFDIATAGAIQLAEALLLTLGEDHD